MNDLKKIEDAVNMYAQENSSFPPDVNGGIKPPELVPYLSRIDFATTPLGSYWDWGNHAGFYRISSDISSQNSLVIDQMIDDGNLSTGNVRYDTSFRYYMLWK